MRKRFARLAHSPRVRRRTRPSDESVPSGTVTRPASDKDHRRAALICHVVPVKALSAEVKLGHFTSAPGADIGLGQTGKFVATDAGIVTRADVAAGNDVVHALDTVPIPRRR